MTPYEELCSQDWVQYFEEKLNSTEVRYDKDGKFKVFGRLVNGDPWLRTPSCTTQDIHGMCGRYQEIFALKMGFIHSRCHECWKVVVAPNTVEELFKLYDYQQDIDIPAKCGIELRPFVPRLYGGYFYNQSLEQGRECHKIISEGVHNKISPDIKVILKRACSEFEIKFGPSDKWKILPEQKEYEDKFDTLFVQDVANPAVMPEYIAANTKRKWLQFAAEAKPPDYTYLKFTGGKYLTQHVEYVTYHLEQSESLEQSKEPLIKVVGR